MMPSTMEAIYRKIELEGVWLVDPKLTTREQQDAILVLRKAGKIEQAAYGGLKVKRDWRVTGTHPGYSAPTGVRELLASVGIQVDRIRYIGDTKGAWARPGAGRQVTVVFDGAVRLNGANVGKFASEVIVDGSSLIMRIA